MLPTTQNSQQPQFSYQYNQAPAQSNMNAWHQQTARFLHSFVVKRAPGKTENKFAILESEDNEEESENEHVYREFPELSSNANAAEKKTKMPQIESKSTQREKKGVMEHPIESDNLSYAHTKVSLKKTYAHTAGHRVAEESSYVHTEGQERYVNPAEPKAEKSN